MKVLFAGTPAIAVPALEALAATSQAVCVLTNPDEPVGRKRILTPSAVKICALEHGLPVLQPESFNPDFQGLVRETGAELLVCFAYGKIFPEDFIALFPRGGINIHPSLLPKFRGPSPLSAAILAGESKTGITIQTLAKKMDCGGILSQMELPLDGTETAAHLGARVAALVPEQLLNVLADMENGSVIPVPQNDADASYCRLVRKGDGLVNWSFSAEILHRMFRAYQPWPGLHTTLDGEGLLLHSCEPVGNSDSGQLPPGTVTGVDKQKGILIQTGEGLLAVSELQLQSRKTADFRSFLNGMPSFIGRQLGG